MRRFRSPVALLVAAGALSAGPLAADPIPEITVRADRPVIKFIGRTSSGAPVRLYQLSYHVSYEDLDLATSAGADALKKRLRDAAESACKDLDRLYPDVEPDRACARKAEDESMSQVTRAIELAQSGGKTRTKP